MLVCSTCGSNCVVKQALVDVNDGSVIEEIGAERRCTECNDVCEAVDAYTFAQREGFDELSAEIAHESEGA